MKWIDFAPLAEFVDRSGVTRSIYGCSLIGRFEFIERQEQINAILDAAAPGTTWEELYAADRLFRVGVDRCLVLNRVDADWLTPGMLEQLLFARFDGSRWLPGWLVELNYPPTPPTERSRSEEGSLGLGELLATLSTHCASLSEAIDLANNMPANLLLETIAAKNEISKSPEEKQEEKKRQQMADLRANYGSLT